ncbi:MAG: Rieske 2Fe-2S domain-containing protein [Acidimicrobiales bacterium]
MLDGDAVQPPRSLRVQRYDWPGDTRIDLDRYTSPHFARLEAERLWPKVWQLACRLEHLPEVGSFITYEVADVGLIVVRTDEHTIKAFHNSCLHRGTTLAEGEGKVGVLRCPFHAGPGTSTAHCARCRASGTSPTWTATPCGCRRRRWPPGAGSCS